MNYLRKKAEATLKAKNIDFSNYSEEELRKLVYELQVYKIEQELQNEELVNNQVELEKSRQGYFELFNLAPVGYILVDQQGIIKNCNLKTSEILGRGKLFLVSKPFASLLLQSSISAFFKSIEKALKVEEKVQVELDASYGRNNDVLHLDMHIAQMKDGQLLCSLLDVTDKKKSDNLLFQTKERFKSLFDNAITGIFYVNTEGDIIEANKKILEILGSPDVNETKKINVLKFAPLIEIGYGDDFKKCLETGKMIGGENHYTSKWGKEIYVRYFFNPIRNDRMETIGVLGHVEDITESKLAEDKILQALKETNEREAEIKLLLQATNHVLEYEDFNHVAEKIFDAAKKATGATSGYVALLSEEGDENELLLLDSGGLPCGVNPDLPMPIRGLREVAYCEKRVALDNDFHNSHWMKYMPDGHVKLDNVLFAPLVLNQKAVGLIGLANKDGDFNERDARMAGAFGEYAAIALNNSKILNALQEKADEMARLNNTKDKLFSIIAHDLKNPLGNIVSMTKFLHEHQEEIEPDRLKRSLKTASMSAEHLMALLNNLLEWTRSQLNTVEVKQELFDLHSLVLDVIALFKQNAGNKNIELKHQIDPKTYVCADQNMIYTVMRNLVSNAIKFSEDSEVMIAAEETKDKMLQVTVQDYGAGIAEKHLAHLFDADYKLVNKGTRNESGTGLGLMIVREFLEKNNGNIRVESKKGKGTKFIIELPKEMVEKKE